MKNLIVSQRIHNRFTRTLATLLKNCKKNDIEEVRVFLIAKDKRGIITKMVELDSEWECHEMPYIGPEHFAEGFIKLSKYNVIPIGIARIGDFDPFETSDRGWVLNDLYSINKESILLSYGSDGVRAENTNEDLAYQVRKR